MKIKITINIIVLNIILLSNVFAGEISKSDNKVLIAEIIQNDFENTLQEGNIKYQENKDYNKEVELESQNYNKEENKENINNIKINKKEGETITDSLKKEEKEIIIKEVLKKEEVKTRRKIEAEKIIVKNETEEDIIKKLLTQKYQNQIDNVLSDIDKKVNDLPSSTKEKIFLKMENSIKTRINLIKINRKISKETKDVIMEIMNYFLQQTQLRKIGL